MCVGVKADENSLRRTELDVGLVRGSEPKTRNDNERKEKAKNAARERRNQEGDYFNALEEMLPVSAPPPSSQQSSLDKTSVIRITVADLKCRDVINRGLMKPVVKDEFKVQDIDALQCLDGFNIVLGQNLDIIYVSENVSDFIGLTQVELLGQDLDDYVHPCDHQKLKKLVPAKKTGSLDEHIEVFVRVKCTVTERGRMVNLKQASFKPLKLTGLARCMPESEEGRVTSAVWLGVARTIMDREVSLDSSIAITKHTPDMKFMEASSWFLSVAGYSCSRLTGVSFFTLVHTSDIGPVAKAFKNLKEHSQMETPVYRLLCGGGGWVWVQTRACLSANRRGSSKPGAVTVTTTQISEVRNKEQILADIQMTAAAIPVKTSVKSETVEETVEVLVADDELMEAAVNSLQFELLDCEKEVEVVQCPAPGVQNAQTVIVDLRKQPPVPSSARTPVIVSHPEHCGHTQKTRAPNAVTANIFSGASQMTAKQIPKPVTESVFSVPKVNTGSPEETSETAEADILAELFLSLDQIDNLDMLAPHAGNKCIPLSRNKEEKQPELSILTFDDLFESNDNSPKSMCDQIPSSPGSEVESGQDVFIKSGRNLMWGNSGGPGEGNKKPRIQNPRGWIEYESGAWPDFLSEPTSGKEAEIPGEGSDPEILWTVSDHERAFRSGESQEIFNVPKIVSV